MLKTLVSYQWGSEGVNQVLGMFQQDLATGTIPLSCYETFYFLVSIIIWKCGVPNIPVTPMGYTVSKSRK